MKRTIEAREVEVCDFCHGEGYLQECDVCGRQYCLADNGMVAGSFGFHKLCRGCDERDDVREICQQFAERIAPLFAARDQALKGLRRVE